MDIFISYSTKDIEIAKHICQILKSKNFHYWISHENGDFGVQYAATIITQISEAKIFLVLVSNASNLFSEVTTNSSAQLSPSKASDKRISLCNGSFASPS